MQKKYIVRLTETERATLTDVIKKLKGSSQKVRRAQVLLKADADGPGWTDARIAEAFGCRTRTVETIRERVVTEGFDVTLNGMPHPTPPKRLDGKQEAQVIAMRLGSPPAGFAHWTLRLLAEKVVELEIVESISHETVRQTLKKWDDEAEEGILGDSAGGRGGVCGQHGKRVGHVRAALRFEESGGVHGRTTGAVVEGNADADSGHDAASSSGGLRI